MSETTYRVMAGDSPVKVGDDQVVVTLSDALEVVEEISEIPEEAEDAVSEFISNNWEELVENLLGIEIPDHYVEMFADFYYYIGLIPALYVCQN